MYQYHILGSVTVPLVPQRGLNLTLEVVLLKNKKFCGLSIPFRRTDRVNGVEKNNSGREAFLHPPNSPRGEFLNILNLPITSAPREPGCSASFAPVYRDVKVNFNLKIFIS